MRFFRESKKSNFVGASLAATAQAARILTMRSPQATPLHLNSTWSYLLGTLSEND